MTALHGLILKKDRSENECETLGSGDARLKRRAVRRGESMRYKHKGKE